VKIGKVEKLYIAPVGTSGIRESKNSLNLVENYGIKDDKFANKSIDKSVMIVGAKPYIMAKEKSINIPSAALGENILLSFDPHTLSVGTILTIGSVQIEITEACTLCKHLSKYSPKLPKLILKHRGVYCKIVKGGVINIDDSVNIKD